MEYSKRNAIPLSINRVWLSAADSAGPPQSEDILGRACLNPAQDETDLSLRCTPGQPIVRIIGYSVAIAPDLGVKRTTGNAQASGGAQHTSAFELQRPFNVKAFDFFECED